MDIKNNTDIPTFFIDGIGEIRFLNGVVRISYGSFDTHNITDTNDKQQPEFKNQFKLIMPITSFLGILKAQQDLYTQLVERNIIPSQTETKLQPNQDI